MTPPAPRRRYLAPPPPAWRARLAAWLRRSDRSGRRPLLLTAAAVGTALIAGLAVALAGVLLQPRFTVLEVAAQRLVPDGVSAQPPVEEVAPLRAFDRRYAVRFALPPDTGVRAVVAVAREQRWRVVEHGDGQVVLEREGVRATVTTAGGGVLVRTQVAPWVRRSQDVAVWVAVVGGALAGGGGLWRWLRRRSGLRAATGDRRR